MDYKQLLEQLDTALKEADTLEDGFELIHGRVNTLAGLDFNLSQVGRGFTLWRWGYRTILHFVL